MQEEIHRALFLSATDRFGGCNHTLAVASFSRIEADGLCSPVQGKNKVMRAAGQCERGRVTEGREESSVWTKQERLWCCDAGQGLLLPLARPWRVFGGGEVQRELAVVSWAEKGTYGMGLHYQRR